MPEPLSPAAAAVLDAFENASDGEYVEGVWIVNERTMLAAVMEAVADQVVPLETAPKEIRGADLYRITQRSRTRLDLLTIAAELERAGAGTA